jgi:P27 family predicted phage terminase small subunit
MGGKGSGGRNRKPTAQKKAEGNPGKRKLNTKEPKALPGEPKKPMTLSAAARKVWPEVVEMLSNAGVLFKSDGLAIAALCSQVLIFKKADAAIAKFGLIHVTLDEETGTSVMRTAPAARIRSDALKQLRALWQAFGLDPSSRSGVRIPDADPNARSETALDAILRSKSSKDDVVN